MKKKKKKRRWLYIPLVSTVLILIIIVIAFPEKLFPHLFPTYIETIESNWGITLPEPLEKNTILNDRMASHGDGDAITVLYYDEHDLERLKEPPLSWIGGKDIEFKYMPKRIKQLVGHIDPKASYCIQSKFDNYIIFELQAHELTIYESYI